MDSAISLEWKSLIPIVGALIGVVGTLVVQFILRKSDKNKIDKKETNIFKGRLGNLLRKIDSCLTLEESSNPINLKKDQSIRILRDHFLKFEIYNELINKLSECEEYFVGNKNFESIRKSNDILWQISIFIHQIDNPSKLEDEIMIELTYKNNIRIYDEIKKMCKNLEEIKEKL